MGSFLTSVQNSLSLLGHPLGIVWLLTLGHLCIAIKRKDKKIIVYSLLVSSTVWISGFGPFTDAVMRSLEAKWSEKAGLDYIQQLEPRTGIIVLGGGVIPSANSVTGLDMGLASDRLLTGIIAFQKGKGEYLVTSDYSQKIFPHYDQYKKSWNDWVDQMALEVEKLLYMPPCQSTKDEADAVLQISEQKNLKSSRWYLVTSASHMDRSLKLFRKMGIDVDPIACDFRVFGSSPTGSKYPEFIPYLSNFNHLNDAVHEMIGTLVYKLRGWI